MTNMRSDAKKTLKLWETKLTQEEREKAMSILLLSKVFADKITEILVKHADKDDDDQLVCDIYKASIAYCDTSKSLATEFDKK